MSQRLLQAVCLCALIANTATAQNLFEAPDTVCVRQPFTLTNQSVLPGNTYYWNFCSGYLNNSPSAVNLGAGFGFLNPSAIDVAQSGGNYYAFVASQGTSELFRLDYGTSLSNAPAVTNLGNLGGALPVSPNSVFLIQEGGNWHLFAAGGTNVANSAITRLDFGASLGGVPTATALGNPGGILNAPRGLFIAQGISGYVGHAVNFASSELVEMNFGGSLANVPTVTNLGNPTIGGGSTTTLAGPTDIAGAQDINGNWHLLIPNAASNSLAQLDFDPTLSGTPANANNLGSFGNKLFGPSAMTLVQDCGMMYGFITNELTNELVRIDMPDLTGLNYTATNLGNLGGAIQSPSDVTRIIREGNELYGYVINRSTSSLSQLQFNACTNASLPSSTQSDPGTLAYDQPGEYNIYFVLNEGTPTAQVQCRQITVLPIPNLFLQNDTTICQGDTVNLVAYALTSDTTRWMPNLFLTDTVGLSVFAYPEYSLEYFAEISFPNGCIVDTSITVDVFKNRADAGPDRMLDDGARTVLGGPLTSLGPQYTYVWTPGPYLDNQYITNPTANPANTLTYYLTVTDNNGCRDVDTVNVFVACNDINLPNAFSPEGKVGANRFGIMNRQIVQLNYFRIYDRWGREVYSTTDVSRGWDGTFNGELVQPGVYVWEADGFCRDNVRFTRSGNVTVFR